MDKQQIIQRIKKMTPQQQALLQSRFQASPENPTRKRRSALYAFIRLHNGISADIEELKAQLKRKLPEYMMPTRFIVLDHFPKLPNGKVDRQALTVVMNQPERENQNVRTELSEIEQTLLEIWRKLLQTDFLDVDDNFFELGGDSIISIQVVSLAHQAGLQLAPNDLFQYPTIALLANHIQLQPLGREQDEAQTIAPVGEGHAPLTPIQHWYFQQNLVNPNYWNQSRCYEITAELTTSQLQEVVDFIVNRHDIFRTCFIHNGDKQYEAYISDSVSVELVVVESVQDENATLQYVADMQSSFNLQQAPLIRFLFVAQPRQPFNQLWICAHHLVIDNISWLHLEKELEQSCRQCLQQQKPDLPHVGMEFRQWAHHLTSIVETDLIQNQQAYWRSVLSQPVGTVSGASKPFAKEGNTAQLLFNLDAENTRRLTSEVNEKYGATALHLLLTALAHTLSLWTGNTSNRIGMEAHGRETLGYNMDAAAAIGWFTAFFPVNLSITQTGWDADIKQIKEMTQQIPDKGLGYGILRYLSKEPCFQRDFQPEILFNYLGAIDLQLAESEIFRKRDMPEIVQRDPANQRAHLLDIDCFIEQGILTSSWRYDSSVFDQEIVQQQADFFFNKLKEIIRHCLESGQAAYTPSDFPDSGLDQDDLDVFIDNL